MAFEPKIKFKTRREDGSGVTLEDDTGTYAANNTGYGSPNPEKTDFGRIILSKLNALAGDVFIEPDDYDAADESNDLFNITLENDGVYTHYMFLIDIYDAQNSYQEGDIVFVTNLASTPYNGDIQKMVGGVFVNIEAKDLLDETILYSHYIDKIHYIKVDNKIKELTNAIAFHTFGLERRDIALLESQQSVFTSLQLRMIQEFCNGNFYESQRTVESFHKLKTYV